MQITSKHNGETDHYPMNISISHIDHSLFIFHKNEIIWIIFLFILIFTPFTHSQSIEIKDGEANTLIQIYDEGDNGGSILFPDALTVDIADNKLYNIGGDLHWNGELIGPCNCDITRTEFDDLLLDFDDLDTRITALENE